MQHFLLPRLTRGLRTLLVSSRVKNNPGALHSVPLVFIAAFMLPLLARAQLYTETQALFSGSSPYDYFGYDLAVSGDTLVASTDSNKRADIYVRTATTGWSLQQRVATNSRDPLAIDGDTLVVGNNIYTRSGSTWSLQQSLSFAVPRPALQGDTLVIGQPYTSPAPPSNNDGAVYVYVRSGTTWARQAVLSPDVPGLNEAMGVVVRIDGDTIVAATGSGHDGAYVFVRSGTTWTRQARLPLPSGNASVAVAIEGNTIAEGDPGNNLVYLYERSGTSWNLTATIPMPAAGNSPFGSKLALSGGILAASGGGMFHLFSKTSSGWVLAETFRRDSYYTTSNVMSLTNHGKTFALANWSDSTRAFYGGIVETFSVPPPPASGSGWHDADVGAVGVAGGSDISVNSNQITSITARGSGADIWDRADQFHFVSQNFSGTDGQIMARVDSAGTGNSWSKVGLMFREDVAPAARTVMVFLTPGGRLGMQSRADTFDTTSFVDGGWIDTPIWLLLRRQGDTFTGYWASVPGSWTPIGSTTVVMPTTIHAGVAVSSHDNATLNTGTFYDVESVTVSSPPPNAPSNLTGAAANGIDVRLQWTDNSTDETGFAIERALGGATGTFSQIATIGANLTNYTDGSTAENTTYSYRVRAIRNSAASAPSNIFTITTPSLAPGELHGQDIGSVGVPGAASTVNGVTTIDAAGADIWDQADSSFFFYRGMTGNFDVRAHITSLADTHSWAKSGVMIRESLDPQSPNVFSLLTAGNAAGCQSRDTFGASTSFTAGPWVRAPYWTRLVRTGNTFQAFVSPDGAKWTLIDTRTVTMAANVYAGIAVTSHDSSTTTRTTVESLTFTAN